MRFQMMAPSSAQIMMSEVIATALESTNPEVMVLATAVPHMAPTRLVQAASTTAWRGVRTLVETTVAMELAVSWKPLMYSKINAMTMTVRTSAMRQEFFRTMCAMILPTSRQRSMTFSNT